MNHVLISTFRYETWARADELSSCERFSPVTVVEEGGTLPVTVVTEGGTLPVTVVEEEVVVCQLVLRGLVHVGQRAVGPLQFIGQRVQRLHHQLLHGLAVL